MEGKLMMKPPETFKQTLYNMRQFVERGEKILAEDLPYEDEKSRLISLSQECYLYE